MATNQPSDYEKAMTSDSNIKRTDYLTMRIYTSDNTDEFNLWIWIGRAKWPMAKYYFGSDEARQSYIDRIKGNIKSNEDTKAENRKKAKAFRHTLKVGSILYTSWGYDQTNVDFFQVTKLLSPHYVEVRMICKDRIGDGQDEVTGIKDAFVTDHWRYSKPMRRKVSSGFSGGNSVKISECETAWDWDGEPKYSTHPLMGH